MKRFFIFLLSLSLLFGAVVSLAESPMPEESGSGVTIAFLAKVKNKVEFSMKKYDSKKKNLIFSVGTVSVPAQLKLDGKGIYEFKPNIEDGVVPGEQSINVEIKNGAHLLSIETFEYTTIKAYILAVNGNKFTLADKLTDSFVALTKNDSMKMTKGDSLQVVIPGGTIKSVKSANKKIATVSSKGVIKAKKAGKTKVTISNS